MEDCAGVPLTSRARGAGGRGNRQKLCDCPRCGGTVHPLASRLVTVGRRGEAVTAQGGGRVLL